MSSPADVEKYLNDHELATAHLPELFGFLVDDDSEVMGYAVESLENCGAPRQDSTGFLCGKLKSVNPLEIYWACTLLGRLFQVDLTDSPPDAVARQEIEQALANTFKNAHADSAALERAVLALGFIEGLSPETCKVLEQIRPTASPRMQRLIATAMGTVETD